MSAGVLEEYRGRNDLVTLLPAGALTARPDLYETVWGRAFLGEAGREVPPLEPAALGALLAASGETPLWQASYACVAADTPSVARDALDTAGVTVGAVEQARSVLVELGDTPAPDEVRALDAIAAVTVLGCLEDEGVGDRIEPVLRIIEGTGDARLALEVQLQDALELGPSDAAVSAAPVPAELTRECAGVDAYAAAAAVELGRVAFDDVADCLGPYATYLADTQVLYRLTAAGGPAQWHDTLIEANVADVASRMQEDGTIGGRSNDSGSAGSTLTALRLLRLAGDADEPLPSWVADGLAVELERVAGAADVLEADLVRHACVLAGAACADPAAHRERVTAALSADAPADGRREAYARMAYELGLEVDLDGEVDAASAVSDRGLLCVAAAFELADPGSTGAAGVDGFWQVMQDDLAEGDVMGASCASWLWRVGSGGQGDDTDRELRRAVDDAFHVGDDGLWRSELSPDGDIALSLYLYEVIGLA